MQVVYVFPDILAVFCFTNLKGKQWKLSLKIHQGLVTNSWEAGVLSMASVLQAGSPGSTLPYKSWQIPLNSHKPARRPVSGKTCGLVSHGSFLACGFRGKSKPSLTLLVERRVPGKEIVIRLQL